MWITPPTGIRSGPCSGSLRSASCIGWPARASRERPALGLQPATSPRIRIRVCLGAETASVRRGAPWRAGRPTPGGRVGSIHCRLWLVPRPDRSGSRTHRDVANDFADQADRIRAEAETMLAFIPSVLDPYRPAARPKPRRPSSSPTEAPVTRCECHGAWAWRGQCPVSGPDGHPTPR